MSAPSAIKVRFETLRSLGFAGITGAYAAVGAAFANPVRLLRVTNLTNTNLLVSFDGTTNHDVVPASGFFLYDYCSNMAQQAGSLEQPIGNRVFVKQEAVPATSGNVYVTVVYASPN